MTPAIQAIWWTALGLALLLTIAAAAYLAAVVRRCGQILELARRTVPAAEGIARNTSAIASLASVIQLAPTLLQVAGQLDQNAGTVAKTLDSVAPQET